MVSLGPLPDVPNGAKIRLIGITPGGQAWVNVLHAKTTGVLSPTTVAAVAAAIRPFWTGDLAPYIGAGYNLKTVEVTDLSSRTGAVGFDTVGAPGGWASGYNPANVAAVLSLKIAQHYRGGHPRMYLPGVPASASTDGAHMTSAVQANYTNAGRAFLGHVNSLTIGSTTWALAAVSYYHKVGGIVSYKNPPELYVILDAICHGRLDTMRRRLGKESS